MSVAWHLLNILSLHQCGKNLNGSRPGPDAVHIAFHEDSVHVRQDDGGHLEGVGRTR
jgi:hypothetical protein